MRWKRMTRQEWAEEKRKARFEWGRKFAWWPWYDYQRPARCTGWSMCG